MDRRTQIQSIQDACSVVLRWDRFLQMYAVELRVHPTLLWLYCVVWGFREVAGRRTNPKETPKHQTITQVEVEWVGVRYILRAIPHEGVVGIPHRFIQHGGAESGLLVEPQPTRHGGDERPQSQEGWQETSTSQTDRKEGW